VEGLGFRVVQGLGCRVQGGGAGWGVERDDAVSTWFSIFTRTGETHTRSSSGRQCSKPAIDWFRVDAALRDQSSQRNKPETPQNLNPKPLKIGKPEPPQKINPKALKTGTWYIPMAMAKFFCARYTSPMLLYVLPASSSSSPSA